ncbi:MAG: sulfotransferase domain-containing protein [Bacteroidia bacterium]|nr:sulfotransferase domain-containing protein [Bacteroidia bacterium]MBT8279060.1 sulfotransferase domain-containing protein [Bacteroidia bacterium]NND24901.1 hypothetical protein [Flavobacteriaceae bacterium]NNK59960.1 hypothetical protein [Flavobacteriaceae bacterium]NNL33087.1 hypothetical protein [Flavobacteriaceae bacterium]
MKVDFLIIGAARSGTTSLSQILDAHPDIGFCSIKEPQFFCKEDWREHLDDYHSLFKTKSDIYGEGSTNYSKFPSFNPNIHADIYEYNPKMKLIYIMRHPIERIISHYKFSVERGYTNSQIDEEVLSNPIYLNTSKYFFQIHPYIERFGLANIKLILLEDFKKDPRKTMQAVFSFLGVRAFDFSNKLVHSNSSDTGSISHKKYDHPKSLVEKFLKGIHILFRKLAPKTSTDHTTLSQDSKTKLIEQLKGDITRLEGLLNRDLSHWTFTHTESPK